MGRKDEALMLIRFKWVLKQVGIPSNAMNRL